MVKIFGSSLIPLGLAFKLCLVGPEFSLGFVFPHCWGRNFLFPNLSLMNHEVFYSGWWEWPLSWLCMNPGTVCSYPVRWFVLWPQVDFPAHMLDQPWTEILKGTLCGSQISLCTIFSSPVLYDENSSHVDLPGLTALSLQASVCFPSLRDHWPSLLVSTNLESYCFMYLPRHLFLADLVPDTPSWSEAEVTCYCFNAF